MDDAALRVAEEIKRRAENASGPSNVRYVNASTAVTPANVDHALFYFEITP
jgi:hypothetical protein